MTPKKIIPFLILIFFIQSCTKDVDFNQLDDARIESTFISTLVYLDLESTNFLNEINEEIVFSDDSMENPINSSSKTDLIQADFTVKTTNTFNRDFSFSIVFKSESGFPIHTLGPVIIPANSGEMVTVLIVPEADIDKLFIAEKIGFEVVMSPSTDGSTILPSDTYNLNIQSAVKLYFNFKTQ